MTLARRGDDRRGDLVELEAPHQPAAARLTNPRSAGDEAVQPRPEPFAFGSNRGEKVRVGDRAEHVEGDGRDKWAATERGGVITRRE